MLEILQLWQLQSESVAAEQSLNSLFFIYAIVCLIVRKPLYLAAFFISEMLFQLSLFDQLKEWQLYQLELILYSYVCFDTQNLKTKLSCATMCLLSTALIVDSILYGAGGYYGGTTTALYNCVESLYIFAHALIILSLISTSRILNSLRDLINSIMYNTANSYYLFVFCYNNKNQQSK